MKKDQNKNCLQDYVCPSCDSREPFWIWGAVEALVHDNGIEDYRNFQWADIMWMKCRQCKFEAQVKKFRRNSFYGDTDLNISMELKEDESNEILFAMWI